MKRVLNFFLAILLTLPFWVLSGQVTKAAPLPSQAPSAPEAPTTGEFLVKFKPQVSRSERDKVHALTGAKVKSRIPQLNVDVVSDGADLPLKYQKLEQIEYIEPNFKVFAACHLVWRPGCPTPTPTPTPNPNENSQSVVTPSDISFTNQWGLHNTGQTGGKNDADIDAPEAWGISQSNSDVKIAILDTGIDQDHEDLAGKIVLQANFSNSPTIDDFYGHGTHVGGIAAAQTNNNIGVSGAGYNASLMNGKVLDDDGVGSHSSVASGIIWAADNGAKVINMSLGSTVGSSTLQNAVNYAWGKGVVLVAAAGNCGCKSRLYPAYYSNVIAVAATNHNDGKASFSTYGSRWVDLAAPGEQIYSTFPNHPYKIGKAQNYDYGSGTSMATPFVSGAAALVWSTAYGTSNTSVRQRLESKADKISGTGSYWLKGRLNASAAVSP